MRGQVKIRAVGNTLEFTPRIALEAELVLDVDRAVRVVRQLVLRMLEQPQVVTVYAQIDIPLQPFVDPILVPLGGARRLDEELHLHLLELTRTEDEVARRDLVAEALAGLSNSERRLAARRGHHVREVDENALRGFRPQIVQTLLGL